MDEKTVTATTSFDRRGRTAVWCGAAFWTLSATASFAGDWAAHLWPALAHLTVIAAYIGLILGVAGFAIGTRVIGTKLGKIAVAITVAPVTAALCLVLVAIGEFLNKHG